MNPLRHRLERQLNADLKRLADVTTLRDALHDLPPSEQAKLPPGTELHRLVNEYAARVENLRRQLRELQ